MFFFLRTQLEASENAAKAKEEKTVAKENCNIS